MGPLGHQDGVLLAVVGHHGDLTAALFLLDPHDARVAGQHGGTLGGTGLEQLDDAGQAVGDVLTDDAAGVEGTHGQLSPGLTDGLGGDDADRLAELDHQAGGQRLAVAGDTDAMLGLAGQHRAGADPVDGGIVAQRLTTSSVSTVPAWILVLSDRVTASTVIRPFTRVSR